MAMEPQSPMRLAFPQAEIMPHIDGWQDRAKP